MEEELLPPGFRFFPTEEELVSFYLRNKLESRRPDICRVIPVVDISKFEPWHLPENSGELCRGDTEQWFFFNPRQEREARGGRPNRTTDSGYWKATGTSSYVYSSDNREIGVKKTMVFYKGKAPTGRKTKWKMQEYKAINEEIVPSTGTIIRKLRHEFSLCRVYVISGTFRAFDRRPMAEVTDDTLLIQQAQGDGAAQSSENAMAAETTSSTGTDSSYSAGNHIDLPPTVGSSNWEMVNPTGPCWDWEQMDWL